VADALAGSARLMLVSGVRHLDPQRAVFEAMLAGWTRQQQARLLADQTVTSKIQAVRRFAQFTNDYPWVWTPADAEEFWAELRGQGFGRATLRSYQVRLRLFCDFVTDARYGWAEECWQRFGAHPVQVCTEANTATHAADYEGSPRRRPFTREELQALFDHADAQLGKAVADGRKGAVSAFRDAVALKVVYAWGLRRREAVMLDLTDWHANPAAGQLGRFDRPVLPATITHRLQRLAIQPSSYRAAALLHLAGEMPPIVLGDILGLGHTAVQDWSTLAGRPWASYAADRLFPNGVM
jgi:integrase/recombinase XerC